MNTKKQKKKNNLTELDIEVVEVMKNQVSFYDLAIYGGEIVEQTYINKKKSR